MRRIIKKALDYGAGSACALGVDSAIPWILVRFFPTEVNAGVMTLAIRFLGLHYLMAKGIAAGLSFGCNFIARRQLPFVHHSPA